MNKKKRSVFELSSKVVILIATAAPLLFTLQSLFGALHSAGFVGATILRQNLFDSITNTLNNSRALAALIVTVVLIGVLEVANQVMNGVFNFLSRNLYYKALGSLQLAINRKSSRITPVLFEVPELFDDINKADEGASASSVSIFAIGGLFTFYFPYFLLMGFYLYSLRPVLVFSLLLIFFPVVLAQVIRMKAFTKLENRVAPIRREFEYYGKCIFDREYFKETRTLGAFSFFNELYQKSLRIFNRELWKTETKTQLAELGFAAVTLGGYVGVLLLLIDSLNRNFITIGAFAAVFYSIGNMFGLMNEIIRMHLGGVYTNLGKINNFLNFLDLPERGGEAMQLNKTSDLEIDNIRFRYPGANYDSLTGVSLSIRNGETLAIVGENGAGKTTLAKIISGIYSPVEGRMTIGGSDTRNASSESIYDGISAVFQNYQRYKMTLFENIAISKLGEYDSFAMDSARVKAGIDVKKTKYPEGENTMLSRDFDGIELSGGEWQRIAIARGFYRPHDIIILDEPTASIDPVEESDIYKKIADASKGKTVVIITHRLGSTKIADKIIVMKAGNIVETGTHEELMEKQGTYAMMYKEQAKWYSR